MWGDDTPEDALAKVQARAEPLERAVAREQQDMAALDDRVAALEQRNAAAAVRADLLVEPVARRWRRPRPGWRPRWPPARAELHAATERADAAQRAADEAEQARHRSAARAEALERALRDLQGAGGRELLRGVDGVVGSLLDLVEIDDGWEAAFEAAAGAGVAAVVVDGRRSAHQALATLRERGVTGAVLAPRAARTPASEPVPRSSATVTPRARRPRPASSCRRARRRSRCAAMCGPATARRSPSRCSTP